VPILVIIRILFATKSDSTPPLIIQSIISAADKYIESQQMLKLRLPQPVQVLEPTISFPKITPRESIIHTIN
jgi:hypothetical protein